MKDELDSERRATGFPGGKPVAEEKTTVEDLLFAGSFVSGTKIGNNEEESEMGGDTRIMVGWTSYLERTQLKTFTNDCMRCIS